jgi:hypothetical protein
MRERRKDMNRLGWQPLPRRGYRIQPRVLTLENNVMITALKGLQWPVPEAQRFSFAGRNRLQIGLPLDDHNLSSLQDGSAGGGYPGINPWAKSQRHLVAKAAPIHPPHRP